MRERIKITNRQKAGIRCRGSFQVFDKDSGALLFENHNMFMNLALEQIAKFVAGVSGLLVPTVVKVGTSNAEVAMGQTALSGSILGTKTVDSATADGSSVKFIASFLAGEAMGVWEEVGLFDTTDLMWSRSLTGTYTKKDLDKIEVHWTYDFFDNSQVA